MDAAKPRAGDARKRFWARAAAFDDGAILKTTFFVMLAGTAWVLYSDYADLNASRPANMAVEPGDPMLPAVERPEIDPDNPAYRPYETVTTPREVLSAPLEIELVSGGVLMLSGTITPGAAASFAQEVERRGDYVQIIALNSPGGSVEDALTIGRLIREKGFATAVGDGALCASSCPLILAGGTERTISQTASVGVHQIYAGAHQDGELGSAQAMSDAQIVTARITRHLVDMDIDAALWLHALDTPPDRLYFLTHAEMEEFGLAGETGAV